VLSDVLGLETTVIELNHGTADGATEATLLGPFIYPMRRSCRKEPRSAATRPVSLWM
jgi:hypothetical protein